jgi:hypothetical protein
MSDMAREIIYPAFVFVLIASVWALGWERSYTDAVQEGIWPTATPNETVIIDRNQPAEAVTSTFDPAD